MPFFFIVPLWFLLVLLSVPLFFVRRLRWLGTHVVIASTLAMLIAFALSTLIIFAVPRLPTSRFSGVVVLGLYVLSILGGGVAGLLLGVVLAHRLNKRLDWWPIPPPRAPDISVRPKNYRSIALAAIALAADAIVLMNGRRISDYSTDGPVTQDGIRRCRDFEIRDGATPILGFHDHPDEMWIAVAYRELADRCSREGWLTIEGPGS